MTGNLLVTPERLISASNEFSNLGQEVNRITDDMLDRVESLSSTWAGEAHTAYQSKFSQLRDDMAKIYSMIREHSQDLSEMARNYQAAESANVEAGMALNAEIID